MRRMSMAVLALEVASFVAPAGLLGHGGHAAGHAGWWGAFHLWVDSPFGAALGVAGLALLAAGIHAWSRRRARIG